MFLLLGAVVNVAVAWGCAVRPYSAGLFSPWHSIYEWISPEGFDTYILKRTGDLRVSQSRTVALVYRLGPPPQRLNDSQYRDLIPDWSAFAAPEVLARSNALFVMEQAAGWPLLCLRLDESRFYGDDRASRYSKTRGRLELPWFEPPWRNAVPYHPIWPGFAINTLFYAAIVWVLWSSPFTARRMIRRKRGLCIKCGYDLRGTSGGGSGGGGVCPECGWCCEVDR